MTQTNSFLALAVALAQPQVGAFTGGWTKSNGPWSQSARQAAIEKYGLKPLAAGDWTDPKITSLAQRLATGEPSLADLGLAVYIREPIPSEPKYLVAVWIGKAGKASLWGRYKTWGNARAAIKLERDTLASRLRYEATAAERKAQEALQAEINAKKASPLKAGDVLVRQVRGGGMGIVRYFQVTRTFPGKDGLHCETYLRRIKERRETTDGEDLDVNEDSHQAWIKGHLIGVSSPLPGVFDEKNPQEWFGLADHTGRVLVANSNGPAFHVEPLPFVTVGNTRVYPMVGFDECGD